MEFITILILIAIIIYIIEIIMNPEKHKVVLVVFAIFAALFGAFSSDNKKKRR